jgi:hypothetical protein
MARVLGLTTPILPDIVVGGLTKEVVMKTGYDPKGIGEKSEAQVLAAFLRSDKVVLLPYGDNQRYDLVVDEDGQFIRVQCKTGRLTDGAVEFSTCSNNWNTKKKRGYEGQADLFAVYVSESDEVYILPVHGLPKTECRFRIEPTKNGQKARTRNASDYRFSRDRSLRSYMGL